MTNRPMAKLISKRISSGLYEITAGSRVFEVEDAFQARADGEGFRNDWNLYEMKDYGNGADREYCQSFGSKKAAMAAVEATLRGEW